MLRATALYSCQKPVRGRRRVVSNIELSVKHAVPGRMRLRATCRQAEVLQRTVDRLQALPQVREVQCNPLTGSILVLHDFGTVEVAKAAILRCGSPEPPLPTQQLILVPSPRLQSLPLASAPRPQPARRSLRRSRIPRGGFPLVGLALWLLLRRNRRELLEGTLGLFGISTPVLKLFFLSLELFSYTRRLGAVSRPTLRALPSAAA